MSSITRYAETVRVPNVVRLLLLGAFGRLPPAMEFVALVLFVKERSDSYAIAGAVTAGYTIGIAVAAPPLGRLIDRYGAARVLWPTVILHLGATFALIFAGLAGLPGLVLVVLGVALGASTPPTGSLVRRVLSQIGDSRRDLRPSIFALDSLSVELIFVGGPALAAVLILIASPAAALIVACAIAIFAVAGLAVMPSLATDASEREEAGTSALRSPGMRTLLAYAAPLGVSYGAFQVTVIAFADHVDASSAAPWLIALLSLGGAAGAFIYGVYGHRFRGSTTMILAGCSLSVCYSLILFAASVVEIAPLAILAGAIFVPAIAVVNQIVGDVAPRGTVTEAYSWVFMAMLSGGSLGLTLGGYLVEAYSWRAGIILAVVVTTITALIAFTRRNTLPEIGWVKSQPKGL